MQRMMLSLFCLLAISAVYPQKKPLDHSVYDSWQSIGERMISNNGKWVVYSINPQEGDNELVIQSTDGLYKKVIPRGYNALVTEDSRFAIFKIKPFFKESREARIRKKRPDDMPKDSFAIVELGHDSVWKIPRVKSFKTPAKEAGWVAWQLEKPIEKKETTPKSQSGEKKIIDSLNRKIDSLLLALEKRPLKRKRNQDEVESAAGSESRYEMLYETDAEGDEPPAAATDAGSELVIRNLTDGKDRSFPNVLEYFFSERGNKLVIEQAKNPRDSLSKPAVSWIDLATGNKLTISNGGNEFKNFSFSEDGSQLAYLAERDAKPKELQKFYKVWYFKAGMDSAVLLVDKNTVGMKVGMTVSEFGNLSFSKKGRRLFFGTAPVQPPKDTSLVEIDLVKLDVWHYNDDYLQTQQLSRLQRDLQTNYLAVCHLANKQVRQLGSKEIPTIFPTAEGDGDQFAGITDFGKRVEGQWAGNTRKDIYVIDVNSGDKKLVKKDMLGLINAQYISPDGTCILWYDSKARNYFAWKGDSIRNISRKIKTALWNEEHDSPSDPPPYGVMGWHEGDSAVYVYDRYDVHRLDPTGKKNPLPVTKGMGRKDLVSFRYIPLDTEKKFFSHKDELLFRSFDNRGKGSGFRYFSVDGFHYATIDAETKSRNHLGTVTVARTKTAGNFILYTLENYKESPD
ncbi:MAG TPA: S9 family peptidase, partial [Chitinophagaceae bacterium]|nr:S9 family peptidase [Chitinophagaceae bacterium]